MITALSLSPAVDKIYFVDNFRAGGLYRVRNVVKSAGGKGINVARVASILGEKVTALGFKAGDTGDWLESELKKLGVDTNFIEVEGESRTNNNIIDREKGTETEVLEVGPYIKEEDMERFLKSFKEALRETRVLVCSGGLPEGVPADFYRRLIEIAKPYGVKIILDTSNEILAEGIKAGPHMVKPNLRELNKLVKRELKTPQDIVEACKSIVSGGVGIVTASMGRDGAILVSEDKVLRARVPEVDVVNTIGSGDSTVAGYAVGLARDCSLEETFRLSMACAVANTQFMEIGYVNRELVEMYSKEIVIEDIEGICTNKSTLK